MVWDLKTEHRVRAAVLEADRRYVEAAWPLLDPEARARALSVRVRSDDVCLVSISEASTLRACDR